MKVITYTLTAAHQWGALCCSLERKSHEQQEKSPLCDSYEGHSCGTELQAGPSQVALVSPGAISQATEPWASLYLQHQPPDTKTNILLTYQSHFSSAVQITFYFPLPPADRYFWITAGNAEMSALESIKHKPPTHLLHWEQKGLAEK